VEVGGGFGGGRRSKAGERALRGRTVRTGREEWKRDRASPKELAGPGGGDAPSARKDDPGQRILPGGRAPYLKRDQKRKGREISSER